MTFCSLLLVPPTSKMTFWVALLYWMFILLTLMSEAVPHMLKPFVWRTSVPNTPAGRAPSNKSVETKGDDSHLTFMVDVGVCGFTVEAVFVVDEISARSRVE